MIGWLLIGPSGAGKSTLGPLLAAKLNMRYLKLDHALKGPSGQPASVMLNLWGPQTFYQRSLHVLETHAADGETWLIDVGAGTQWTAFGQEQLLQFPTLCLWRNPEAQWHLNQLTRQETRSLAEFTALEYSPAREQLYQSAQVLCDLSACTRVEAAWDCLQKTLEAGNLSG